MGSILPLAGRTVTASAPRRDRVVSIARRPPGVWACRSAVDRLIRTRSRLVHDVRAEVDRLRAGGVPIRSAPHRIHVHEDGIEAWMAFFDDLDGCPLAVTSRSHPAVAVVSRYASSSIA